MIPASGANARQLAYRPEEMPWSTYRLDIERQRVSGQADRQEAVRQAIYLMLNTERYTHPIYSWRYGVELSDLIGQPVALVLPEIKRRITEALLTDERIMAVEGWEFETKRGSVLARFVVRTALGDIESAREVEI